MERLALIVACVALWVTLSRPSHATPETKPSWVQELRDEFDKKIKKIEALITLSREEKPVSEPLTDKHLELPLKSIGMIHPQVVPGMEPAKSPTPSKPVVYGYYVNQYDRRGNYTGQVFVPYKKTTTYQQYSSGCSSGNCGRGGIF